MNVKWVSVENNMTVRKIPSRTFVTATKASTTTQTYMEATAQVSTYQFSFKSFWILWRSLRTRVYRRLFKIKKNYSLLESCKIILQANAFFVQDIARFSQDKHFSCKFLARNKFFDVKILQDKHFSCKEKIPWLKKCCKISTSFRLKANL